MANNILDELLSSSEASAKEDAILLPLAEELDLIEDPNTKAFVRSLLLKVANVFWTGPASASGRWHPPDERGLGGNVLHTKRVVRVVSLLAESEVRSQYQRDILVAAAILHDLLKNIEWKDGTIHSDPMHMYMVDGFVERARSDDKKYASRDDSTTLKIDETVMHEILRLVRVSHGTWSPIPETFPVTQMDWLMHHADRIAAKLHYIIDGENVVESRWNANPDDRPGD